MKPVSQKYDWTQERIAILNEYKALSLRVADCINENFGDFETEVINCKAKMKDLAQRHKIEVGEYRAFLSRKSVKCSTVEQAMDVIANFFNRKMESKA